MYANFEQSAKASSAGLKLGWGHNPGLAVLTKVLAADAKDAEQAVGKNVFELLLSWTLISGSYCHPTKLLFSSKSSDRDAELRMVDISMAETDVKRFHGHTRVDSKTALELAEPLWRRWQSLSASVKTQVLSSVAAYRSALGVQRGIQFVPTLAVVAYLAALESLMPPPNKCEGDVTCSKCGALPWKHDKTGHLKTVLQTVPRKRPAWAGEVVSGVGTILKAVHLIRGGSCVRR